jgi:anti-sigma regulatory factor (Ser/Thr protein kinase)
MLAMADPTHTCTDDVHSVVLAPKPESAADARTAVRTHLAAHGLATDDAEAVASELVANAVAATLAAKKEQEDLPSPHVTLTITIKRTYVDIVVWDVSPRFPPRFPIASATDLEAEDGRGLQIVDYLSDSRWGCYKCRNGKAVWASTPKKKAEKSRERVKQNDHVTRAA